MTLAEDRGCGKKTGKRERQRTFLGHPEGGSSVESEGTLAFHLTCCSSGYTKSFIAILHGNECTNVNAEPPGFAFML